MSSNTLQSFSTFKHPIVGDINISTMIGKGANAEVWNGYCPKLHSNVALKMQFSDTPINTEIEILKKANHPNIIRYLFDIEVNGFKGYSCDLVRGQSIIQYVNFNGPVSEDWALILLLQLTSALKHLHNELHVVHRDIKCENILLDENQNIKIIDFGFSNYITEEKPFLNDPCGSLAYASPEVLEGVDYSYSTDIWSLGVVLYAMTVGCLPFHSENSEEMIKMILDDHPVYPKFISPDLANLLSRMLCKDPSKRITLDGILEHPFAHPVRFGKQYCPNIHVLNKFKIIPKNIAGLDNDVIKNIHLNDTNITNLIKDLINRQSTLDEISYLTEKTKRVTDQMVGIFNYLMIVDDNPFPEQVHKLNPINLGGNSAKAITKPGFVNDVIDRAKLRKMSCSGTPARPLLCKKAVSRLSTGAGDQIKKVQASLKVAKKAKKTKSIRLIHPKLAIIAN